MNSNFPLGQRLQQLRQSRGLTQQRLANAASISLSTLTKLEQGTIKSPSITVLNKLIQVLEYDLDDLLSSKPLPAAKPVQPTTRPPIKFIYFDIGGVLIHTISLILQKLSNRIARPYEQVSAIFYTYAPYAYRGQLTQEDLQILLLLKLNLRLTPENRRKLFKDWIEDMRPITETHDFIEDLAERYKIALLSNIMVDFYKAMQKQRLIPNLKYAQVILSCEVDLIKPEQKIYELATGRAKVAPNNILFFDDQRINVKAAKAYGWQAEWFNELNPTASIARIKRKYFS